MFTRRTDESLATEKWERVGEVKALYLYPLKSGAGVPVPEATIERNGLRVGKMRDRALMVIDQKNNMLTARKVSPMVLLTTDFEPQSDIITIKFPHMQPLSVDLSMVDIEGELKKYRVWDSEVQGLDCGPEASEWLSLALGRKCFLISHGQIPTTRAADKKEMQKYPLMMEDDSTFYADGYGYMMMTESSVKDLQSRVKIPIHHQNFRPNILVDGPPAYDEDNWSYVKIGDTTFRNIKPCSRCVFTTIDYESGTRDKNMEPLKTLKKYRIFENDESPSFGVNLAMERGGKMKVGDDVLVLRG